MIKVSSDLRLAQGTSIQISAADPSKSVWVSANAGTGKTRVLIDRISRLLLTGTSAHRILCLTFTKAAAAEMANRLNERLGDWAAMREDKISEALLNLLGRPATEVEIARAPMLFAETMELPEGLRIRTIHSFCESLLGRFPLESGVAPHFTVIDERRAAELREEARDHVLQKAAKSEDTDVSQALSHLAALVDEDGFARVMAELDTGKHKLYAMIDSNGGLDALIAAGRQQLGLELGESRENVIRDGSKDTAFDMYALARAAATLQNGSKTDAERATTLNHWLELTSRQRAVELVTQYMPIFLKQNHQPRKTLMTSKPAKANPEDLEALKTEQKRIFNISEKLKAVTIAENTQALLTIGSALLDTYLSLKKTRALIDYDDLIEKAHNLLGSPTDVSWVHYKLDGGIDHILVDEAQDTSPMQWSIIEGLAGDFFSSKNRSIKTPRTIFAVGDEKQSIYSFQGAEPVQFGNTGEKLRDKAHAANNSWSQIDMALSWRSTPAILSAVDAVFGRESAAEGLSWGGRPVHHRWSRDGESGLVELWPLSEPSPESDDNPWDAPLDQVSAASPEVRLAARISDTISRWIETGEKLTSQGRAISPGDIMILVRSRGIFAEEMVRALKDREIAVAGRDRIIMTEHLAVMDLIAAGRFALLAEDELNTATVLKGPFIEMGEDALFNLAYKRKGDLWTELIRRQAEEPIFNTAHARLSKLRERADQMPPYEFFSTLLTEGGYESLVAHLGPEAAEPIDEFIALTLDFERDHIPSLEAFLHWIGQGKTEVKRDLEQSGKEVRVMTAHGAKGLQSRIVFLADTCSVPSQKLADKIRWGNGFVLWPTFKENEEAITAEIADTARARSEHEYRRLLYVAMTRAEDRLYICGWKGIRDIDENCWYRLVEKGLKDLPDTQIIDNTDNETLLRLISPQTVASKNIVPSKHTEIEDVAVPDWALKPHPPEPSLPQPLSPSQAGEEPAVHSPLSKSSGETFKRGRLIHALLQTLPEIELSKRREAARHFLALPTHELNTQNQKAILSETLSVLEAPHFAVLFGPGSRAEVPIVGTLMPANGGAPIIVSGQVDRLLITEKEVGIIDYKTNRPPPAVPEEILPTYLRQIAIYRALLQAIYPGRTTRAAILWTDSARLMALPEMLLDAHAP